MADDTATDDIETWLRALWEFFDGPDGTTARAAEPAQDDTSAGTRLDAR